MRKDFIVKSLPESVKKELTIVPHSTFGNFQEKPIECFLKTQDGIRLPFY